MGERWGRFGETVRSMVRKTVGAPLRRRVGSAVIWRENGVQYKTADFRAGI